MSSIDYATLRGIAFEAGLDPDESIRTDYSGRGMYGKQCVAFDLEAIADLFSLGGAVQAECGADVMADFAGRCRTDSMGMGMVAYFPGITCEDGPDDDE